MDTQRTVQNAPAQACFLARQRTFTCWVRRRGLGEAEGKLAVVQLRSLLSSGLRDALPAARKAVSTAEDFRRFSGAESEA